MISTIQRGYNALFDATIAKLSVQRIWDGINREPPHTRRPLTRIDIYLALVLAMVGMSVCIWGFIQTNRVPELHTTFDLWFDADIGRVTENLVSATGNHARTSVHPISSILLYPFGKILTLFGIDPLTAAKTLLVCVMGANTFLFSLITRLLDLPRYAVALFTLLFVCTASFIFWGSVVESHPFSSFSVLLALFMMLRVNTAHWGWWVLVNMLTLGLLITNWVFGLIAMAVRLRLKPFIAICLTSFAAIATLAVVQNATFERAALFFNPETLLRETDHTQASMAERGYKENGWRPVQQLRSFYITTVVAMPVEVQHGYKRLVTTNQYTSFPAGELSPIIAVIAWVVLFGMGLWGAVRRKDIRLLIVGAATLLGLKTLLYTVYGPVTFLYNQEFVPLLLLFASLAWHAPYRHVASFLAGTVIIFAGINNERRLQETIDLADCLTDIEFVLKLHSYELNKVESPYLTDSSSIYTEDVVRCDQLIGSQTNKEK